ncbi:MAG: flippase-like domain-containing protein [Deltaproteobacteria bacterium]|nr:flippase-like domain-containing protein [Deltaproteobacteria bacterium]
MSTLLRRTLYSIAAGITLYVVVVLWFDVDALQQTLVGYPWALFVAALALSAGNYLLRFAKWELSLHWLRVRDQAPDLTVGRSLLIYLAGLLMSVTPGKVGEVLRSTLLKASDGIPFTRTAPVVVADRLTDLIALVLLAAIGVAERPEYVPILVITLILVSVGVGVLGSPRLLGKLLDRLDRIPRLRGIVAKARPLIDSSVTLMQRGPMFWLSVLSVIGWGLECVGFWLIVNGFTGVDASLRTCTLLWSAGTLVGALSFLPGGLGATEGSLVVATTRMVAGATQPVAMAAALLGRTATLWFGELVGGVALALFLRNPAVRGRALDGDDEPADDGVGRADGNGPLGPQDGTAEPADRA